MKFNRQTQKIGKCRCVISIGNSKGSPIVRQNYAVVIYRGRRWMAHRLSFHLNKSLIPRQEKTLRIGLILHTCDNKWCIEPSHLYKGTSSQNKKDFWDRCSREWKSTACASMSKAAKKRWKIKPHQHTDETKTKMSKLMKGRKDVKENLKRALSIRWSRYRARKAKGSRRSLQRTEQTVSKQL